MHAPSPFRFVLLTLAGTLMTIAALNIRPAASAEPRAAQFTLDNGMMVVVIPDHRAPIVTHMVWYKVGAADEPPGRGGVAHFFEHLMFKGTEKYPDAQFSKIIARNGGQDNAFTAQDVTAYFQSVAKDKLPLVMEMEADRMVNLKLTEDVVLTERDVILEERRSRVENNPSALMNEQMDAALYMNHPYGRPVIGWYHEMAALSREQALEFYKRYYAPNNAILVVAGDVEPEEVLRLAKETYGKIPANPETLRSARPKEPPALAQRSLRLVDPRVGQATFERDYLVPSYATAQPREAEALDILMKVLASGATSRLYRSLVVEQQKAASVGGYYSGSALDYGKLSIYAVANDGVSLSEIEAEVDRVIADVITNGITEKELQRARNSYIADYIYEADSQGNLARRYGWGLATGQSIADIEEWPERLKQVTVEDIRKAAATHLDQRKSVTGWLMPAAPTASVGDGQNG